VVYLSDFNVGNKVRFVKEFDCNDMYENPNYLPPLPAGTVGEVVIKKPDHLAVSVTNPNTGEKSLALVWDVNYPHAAETEKIGCLELVEVATTVKCLTCGLENEPQVKFCVGCGRPIQRVNVADSPQKPKPKYCPNCGCKLMPIQKFCIKCGTKNE